MPSIINDRYLISMIEFKKDAYSKIESIDINISINGTKLKKSAFYLYKGYNKKEKKWDVVKIKNISKLPHSFKPRALAVVFEFPKNIQETFFNSPKKLFENALQTIQIEYQGKKINYQFELKWYKLLSFFDKILTIT